MLVGKLYLDGSAQATSVTYSLRDEYIELKDTGPDKAVRSFKRSELQVQSRLGNLPREIVLETSELLVLDANEQLDTWLAASGASSLDAIERSRKWLISSVVLIPVLLYGIFVHGIPYMAVSLAHLVPDSVKAIASSQTLAALDYTILDPSTIEPSEQSKYQAGFSRLIEQLPSERRAYNIQFRSSETFGPNAFALPDGTIVFTDQFVELVEGKQTVLDAVLLHEIGHVEHNHSMQLIAESLVATLAISYFIGDLSGAVEAFFGVGQTVLQNRFSQAHEWEADNYALEQLTALGRDPEDFAEAMEKLASIAPDSQAYESWFETHPNLKMRISNAQQDDQQDSRHSTQTGP